VTFSPDGDGRNDAVTIRVRARQGDRLSIWLHPETRTAFYLPAREARAGVTTVHWDGLQSDGSHYPNGSYVLRVCDTVVHRCSSDRVLAHLRLLSVYVRRDTAVSVGDTLRVNVATDRLGPYAIDLVSGATPDGEGIGTTQVPRPGWADFKVPAVPAGGLWLLRVRSGGEVSNFPLVVHEPTLSLASPPPHTALVVYPYLTWRAYDAFDENRDGIVDSWYAHPRDPVVPLYGPFEPPAMQPSLDGREPNPASQTAFTAWMLDHKLKAQHVTDVELGRIPTPLLQRYAMIVFEGHTEYYEPATYAKVLAYRNAGGRLYFMQGNSFYGAAEVGTSSVIRLSYRYRTASRSDFALAVTGFRSCCWPATIRPVYHLAPGVVEQLPWLFAGTTLQDGDPLGVAFGEVDTLDPKLSPPGSIAVATATVPAFTPATEKGAFAWIGTTPTPYQPSWVKPRQVDIAYAQIGKGEVFSWANTGFLRSVHFQDAGLSADLRAQLDRVALNVWERFTR
jgi:N,N-dimethylformamidase beta subunit-like, C-terminal